MYIYIVDLCTFNQAHAVGVFESLKMDNFRVFNMKKCVKMFKSVFYYDPRFAQISAKFRQRYENIKKSII